jgi:hypothetical protein
MDPEIKQRFDGLESAMVRLAEGLEQTNARMAQGFAETSAAIASLARAQERTEERLGTLTERVETLTARVDRMGEFMIRGYTDAAERHAVTQARLDKLEGG